MPFKFACEHCNRALNVSSSKIGRRAKCPGCGETITVPDKEAAAESMTRRKATGADEEVDANPFSQFTVFDDVQLVYETTESDRKVADQLPVDHDRVAVSRRIVYAQGVLLGVVALLFFVFGVLVGSGSKSAGPAKTETVAVKCKLTGVVAYQNGPDSEQPDTGALVIVLPENAIPDERVEPLGLRPNSPADPDQALLAKRAIREIGGYYANADQAGRFSVEVANGKKYHVLYVSGNALRPAGTQRPPEEGKAITEIEEYIYPLNELIEQNEFRWALAVVPQTAALELDRVVFD